MIFEDNLVTVYPKNLRSKVSNFSDRIIEQESYPSDYIKQYFPICFNCKNKEGKPLLLRNVKKTMTDCPICCHAIFWQSKIIGLKDKQDWD
ncbi:hypothetical protein CMK18_22690 [Candidatus Poribacteria bacterium]|nr:hypothetical protein [Candidatus Poribacteria bacterium]